MSPDELLKLENDLRASALNPQAAELLSKLKLDANHYVVAAALDASMGTGL